MRSIARSVAPVLLTAALLLAAGAAEAALSTEKCLAQKRKAWAALRACTAAAETKELLGRAGDAGRCESRFALSVAKIDAKAEAAEVACRYRDNGDFTVTDYDTGLQWEKKTGVPESLCLLGDVHCVNLTYTWSEAQVFASGRSEDGLSVTPVVAGYEGWRLPTIVEIRTLVVPGCPAGPPCIDPILGATRIGSYWSSTSEEPSLVWIASFNEGLAPLQIGLAESTHVRAVRSAF